MLSLGLGSAEPSRAAEVPPSPGSREAFESDLARYLPYFRGLLGSDLRAVAPEGAASRWTFRATADGAYTDNTDLSESGRDAFSSDANLGVSWLRRAPRLDASLDGRYTFPLFRSSALEGRNLDAYSLAAAGRWQAASHLSFTAGADVDHNVESGLREAPEGVSTGYRNRFDNYTAHAEYAWRALESLTTTGSYRFRFRNYRGGTAEGEDSRAHDASLQLQYRPLPLDAFVLGYGYGLETSPANAAAGLPDGEERTNHKGEASWAHQFRIFTDDPLKTAKVSYALDRGDFGGGNDYWFHGATVELSSPLSPRTDVTGRLGFRWLLPGREDGETGWAWGAGLAHRFTPYTTGSVSLSKDWQYAVATSKTERTVLSEVQTLSADLQSQLTRYWQGNLSGGYDSGTPLAGGGGSSQEYWGARAAGSLIVRLGQKTFVEGDAKLSRRCTKASDDDYWLYTAGLSFHTWLLEWLSGALRYSYERRVTDSTSALVNYRENLLYASLTVEW